MFRHGTTLVICFLFSTLIAHAQYADVITFQTQGSEGNTTLYPNTLSSLTVESPSLELSSALIVWNLDGAEIARGIGKSTTSLTLSDTHKHTLSVTVAEAQGVTRTETFPLRASRIVLAWEADTFVPFRYKGRALPSQGSSVRIEALQTDGSVSVDTTRYNWKVNGKLLTSQSGIGKYTLQYAMPLFEKTSTVTLVADSITGERVGTASVSLYTVPPTILIYERKPLVGIWLNKNISKLDPRTTSADIIALPFYLSAKTYADTVLTYSWRLSSQTEEDLQTSSNAEIRVSPSSTFSVTVEHVNIPLQNGVTGGSLSGDTSASLFGL
jgi:hypothetical protein